jgi:hypothetical protein
MEDGTKKPGESGFQVILSKRHPSPIPLYAGPGHSGLPQNLEVMGDSSACGLDRKGLGGDFFRRDKMADHAES